MNDIKALRTLLAKVEAGERPWRETCDNKALGWYETDMCLKAFSGSLDAAKALHEAVLPGWVWATSVSGVVMHVHHPTKRALDQNGRSEIPAPAWLIAIIKALIAKEAE